MGAPLGSTPPRPPASPRYLIVTVDTEEDMPGWRVLRPPSVRNARGLPALQEVCDRVRVKPTYLVTHPMATEADAVAVLRELRGRSEMGAHLHAWTCPPFDAEDTSRVCYQARLSPARQREKLRALVEAIREHLEVDPSSHRAGRFGLDAAAMGVVEEMGFLVDSSVLPMADLREDGGPDFRDAPLHPYHPHSEDLLRPGGRRVLEVPVGQCLTRALPGVLRRLYVRLPRWTRLRGLLSRDWLGLVDMVRLYPTRHGAEEMVRAALALSRLGVETWVVFLHSSELTPGMSPYTHTADEVQEVLRRTEEFLRWAVGEAGAVPCTLTEYALRHHGRPKATHGPAAVARAR